MNMKIYTHHLTILALKLSILLPMLLEATGTLKNEPFPQSKFYEINRMQASSVEVKVWSKKKSNSALPSVLEIPLICISNVSCNI